MLALGLAILAGVWGNGRLPSRGLSACCLASDTFCGRVRFASHCEIESGAASGTEVCSLLRTAGVPLFVRGMTALAGGKDDTDVMGDGDTLGHFLVSRFVPSAFEWAATLCRGSRGWDRVTAANDVSVFLLASG